jgi:hypothetical protein
MRFTAMAYNIMRIFEETSKAKNPDRIHPSDKKYNEALKKDRQLPEALLRIPAPVTYRSS